ncbi:hypothetical protein [Subtercola endophyticus]|uniref:hypothetical protein n=1 Tax=Subtercola endophyticus TaxID=2895559 RepID=UPI001E405567|nr:hypothetical protein [Subtercola endophyticus]UFS60738.1 hypothetical protein LQ955_08385 [Subtercola endophyticus]
MSINTRTRLAVLCTAALIALTTAVGGASAAQAAPSRLLSQVTFVAPEPYGYPTVSDIDLSISEPGLPASAFDASIFCADGNSYSVPISVSSGARAFAFTRFKLPSVDSGKTCNFTIGVTSQYRVKLDPIGLPPLATMVDIRGSMPTYSSTGGL